MYVRHTLAVFVFPPNRTFQFRALLCNPIIRELSIVISVR